MSEYLVTLAVGRFDGNLKWFVRLTVVITSVPETIDDVLYGPYETQTLALEGLERIRHDIGYGDAPEVRVQ